MGRTHRADCRNIEGSDVFMTRSAYMGAVALAASLGLASSQTRRLTGYALAAALAPVLAVALAIVRGQLKLATGVLAVLGAVIAIRPADRRRC
jgi:hypothetical protein